MVWEEKPYFNSGTVDLGARGEEHRHLRRGVEDGLRALDVDALVGSGLLPRAADVREAETFLRRAWATCRTDTDPELTATIALQNAMHCYGRLDGAGTVTRVEILSANPRRVFDRAVIAALSQWRFNEGAAGRTVESEVEFKR